MTELVLAHPQHGTLKTEIENLTSELNSIQPIKNEELEQEKQSVQQLVKEINAKLGIKLQIAAADNRIKELEQEESKLSNSLLELEKQEFDIEKFIKLGIEALENSINDKFSLVKFRLFETQINGGEIECCDALINGVPFDSANTASKINAGIDIINTLCEYYQVNAPIIIDNRESVSKLIDSNSQIINLIVSESDAQLRVSSKVEKLQTA